MLALQLTLTMFVWVRFGEGEWGEDKREYPEDLEATTTVPLEVCDTLPDVLYPSYRYNLVTTHHVACASSHAFGNRVRPAVESPERRCFCIDVTCDNLLDAVKQTVEEETTRLRQRREAELAISLREAVIEEQQLAAKAGRFEGELCSGNQLRAKHRNLFSSIISKQTDLRYSL